MDWLQNSTIGACPHLDQNREEELKNRLLDLLDAYGYNINGFQKAMRQMLAEDHLEPSEWQMLQRYTATDLL